MNAFVVGLIVFASAFGGALLGHALRKQLPPQHLSGESKDVVRLGMGLVGTMVALLLGLLVASAKGKYDETHNELAQMSAEVLFLDRLLAVYGPETADVRQVLRAQVAHGIAEIWPHDTERHSLPAPANAGELFSRLEQLTPQNDTQRGLKSQAISVATELGQLRWVLYVHGESAVIRPLLVMMIVWLALIFVSFGLHAPPNVTVVTTLLLCALSVATAVFLVAELDHPFGGLIKVSSHTMRTALKQIGS